MLMEVKCVGSSRSPVPLPGRRSSGSSATTIGNSRMALSVTASATSNAVAPPPIADTMITCAGPAHTTNVDSVSQIADRPASCASAPMPT